MNLLSIIIFLILTTSAAMAQVKPVSKPRDKSESEMISGLQQAAQILEQIWNVMDPKKKLLPQKNPFLLISRAVEKQSGDSKKIKKIFPCEKITTSTSEEVGNPLEKTRSFYFSCQKNRIFFARLIHRQEHRIDFELDPQALEDILGLQTSILGKKMSCELSFDKKSVSMMTCNSLQMDLREGMRALFEKFEYQKTAALQVQADVLLLEQIKPIKKIQIRVPDVGTVKVVETWLSPPPGYVEKGTQKKVEAAANAGTADKAATMQKATDGKLQTAPVGLGVSPVDTPQQPPPAAVDPDQQAEQSAQPDQIFKQQEEKKNAEPEYIEGQDPSAPAPIAPISPNTR